MDPAAGGGLPTGKAVDYRMDITFMEADQFYLVDLQSQLAASGWPYHVQALVTAPPAAPTHLTFHRELQGGTSTIVVSWAADARFTRGAEVRHHVHGHREPAQ